MISLRSGLCILASTGVSLQKVVPLGIHTNVNTYAAVSYWSCFVFFCRRFWRFFIICFLSPSCVVRYLHLRFVGLFIYFVVRVVSIPYVSCSGYGLVPVLSVSCSISFRACLIQISFFVLWLSILLKFIWYGHHHPRHVLVASYRPPFVLIRPHIRIRATLLRIAASAKLSHVILRLVNQPPRPALTRCRRLITLRFRCLPHAIPGVVWSATIISCDHPPIIMGAQLRTYSLLNSLIHLLLSSLCSQSATCSFLFRVILLLAVVN